MNVFPIKLVRSRQPRTTRIVEWKLSNVCNFNCSFCAPEFKDGSQRPLEYEHYVNLIDSLMDKSEGKNIWFQFTGGEPTLYPRLIDLLSHIKSRGGYTSVISNGSRTIRYWKDLAEKNVLNRLFLSYHPEQQDTPDHTIEVNEIMQNTDALVSIFVSTQADKNLFQKAIDGHFKILKEATTISSLKAISVSTSLQPYTTNQLTIIQKNLRVKSVKWKSQSSKKFELLKKIPWYDSGMTMHFDNGTTISGNAQYFVDHGLNNFRNWECDIGKDVLVIEVDKIFRGVCGQGGQIFHVSDPNIFWKTDSIICQKEFCNCGLDIQEPKRKLNS